MRRMIEEKAHELLERAQDLVEDLPEPVESAINELMTAVDGDKIAWWKRPFFKDGEFSKTAMFATIANFLVLFSFVLGWFQGTELGPWTVPAFDTSAAVALMAIANGTYVANNQVKKSGR